MSWAFFLHHQQLFSALLLLLYLSRHLGHLIGCCSSQFLSNRQLDTSVITPLGHGQHMEEGWNNFVGSALYDNVRRGGRRLIKCGAAARRKSDDAQSDKCSLESLNVKNVSLCTCIDMLCGH